MIIENGVLIEYRGKHKNYIIPHGVTKIRMNAFLYCTSLKSVTIPNSVTYIDDYAFEYCTQLSTITISNSLKHIGHCAFGCVKPIKRPQPIDGKLVAYKAFHYDWSCMKFQYEVGKSYHQDGDIKLCKNGFHACLNPLDIFNYYSGELSDLHFAEVELSGTMDDTINTCDTKVAASDIKIIRELTVSELMDIYNSMEKIK